MSEGGRAAAMFLACMFCQELLCIEDPGTWSSCYDNSIPPLCVTVQLLLVDRATHTYRVKVSMFEIYNESVRDLLGGEDDAGPSKFKQLEIRRNAEEGTFVEGLTSVTVDMSGVLDLEALLGAGFARRCTSATTMNEHSSRSHMCVVGMESG